MIPDNKMIYILFVIPFSTLRDHYSLLEGRSSKPLSLLSHSSLIEKNE